MILTYLSSDYDGQTNSPVYCHMRDRPRSRIGVVAVFESSSLRRLWRSTYLGTIYQVGTYRSRVAFCDVLVSLIHQADVQLNVSVW